MEFSSSTLSFFGFHGIDLNTCQMYWKFSNKDKNVLIYFLLWDKLHSCQRFHKISF